MSEYKKVAKTNEIENGSSKIVEIDGDQIAVFNIDGNFYAIPNVCPHAGGPVGEGELEGDVVTCPWHGWQFNVKTGESPVMPGTKICTLPVKIEGENVLVSVE